nr:bifunctional proline dehydrogenase/L-glutamate gamma-semialdehyde dehydrogenase PutA [Burkholderiaceae bacterium]
LLAYLVRRLLENGANTSFVNRIADPDVPLDELVQDPVALIDKQARADGGPPGSAHPAIALPADLYGAARRNSRGLDLASETQLAALAAAWTSGDGGAPACAAALLADGVPREAGTPGEPVRNPADRRDIVGTVHEATAADVDAALALAATGADRWGATAPGERAARLERAADALEAAMPRFMHLLMREAGKTAANAVAEVREAVDFLRYYAQQARTQLDDATCRPLGPVACISPWNFPLAIFLGQVGAALAAGNAVLAKPAEQTPLVAAEAVRLLWAAGVPRAALQLLPGRGEVVGARLVADPRVQGVLFTGSTDVARVLQRALTGRVDACGHAVPLVAETGGQNAMLVDSSALPEQVVADVIASAFDSAGQRCSALRVLCVQEEAADRILDMLLGAMAELTVGDPAQLSTDVGPVIDEAARDAIEAHVERMRARGLRIHRAARHGAALPGQGVFVWPTLIEIGDVADVGREVFGPVLHLLRFGRDDLPALMRRIADTGYGLTLGLHTRIDETIAQVADAARVGNVYVNRNMVGAVVGVQPFGGEGLSGTGPKAGGPLYLWRLLAQRPADVLTRALAPLAPGVAPAGGPGAGAAQALGALRDWAARSAAGRVAQACTTFAAHAGALAPRELAGPTGERNVYTLVPRDCVLCIAGDDLDRLVQLAAVLSVGGRVLWPDDAAPLRRRLPALVQARIDIAPSNGVPGSGFDAVLLHGPNDALARLQRVLAGRDGPVVGVERIDAGADTIRLERLVIERSFSINTAAAGGNASLMAIG